MYSFIKIHLRSGKGGFPLGERNIDVYYECEQYIESIHDDMEIQDEIDNIENWVNTKSWFDRNDFEVKNLYLLNVNEEDANKIRKSETYYKRMV